MPNFKEDLQLCLVQFDPLWEKPAENLKRLDILLKSEKGDLFILPETFTTGFIEDPKNLGESMDGLTVRWMMNLAKKKQALVIGSLVVLEDDKHYNRMIWAYPDGEIKYYDKAHLFAFGGESKHFTAGLDRKIFEYKGWRFMPQVCYDLRFPVWGRNTNDYDILINVASWPSIRSFAWRQLLIARAIENQAYVVGVSRVGMDGNGIEHNGLSAVINFDGETLLEVRDREMIVNYRLMHEPLYRFRRKFPFLKDRDSFEFENTN